MLEICGRMLLIVSTCFAIGCQSTPPTRLQSGIDRDKVSALNTQLGIAYIRDGEYELAYKKLEKALAANPRNVDTYNGFGLLYSRIGEPSKAEEHYQRALGLDKNNASTLNNYGQFLCQQGRYEEGEAKFLAASANPLFGDREIAFSNAGICALQAQATERAEKHFRAALELNPRLAPALAQMAELNYANQKYLPARAYLQRYEEVASHTPRTLLVGVRVERALGNRDTAASYALRLRKQFPDTNETAQLEQLGSF